MPHEEEILTIANLPSDIIRIIFRSEDERRNKESIVSIRLISHEWEAIVRELAKDNKQISITFDAPNVGVAFSTQNIKYFGVENMCDSAHGRISRPLFMTTKKWTGQEDVDEIDDTIRRILCRCSSVTSLYQNQSDHKFIPLLQKCIGSAIIHRVMSSYTFFGQHSRAENIDLIRGQSVKKIAIINRNADVEALQQFITEASPLLQLLEIYENVTFPPRRDDSFFEKPRAFWEDFFKALSDSGKVTAHFYIEEDTEFDIYRCNYRSLMYVHATNPIDAKQLWSPLFNCECF
ncbi:hypothetical protein PRIPAC_88448, partial [Pristionchus pacificus]|uniref:Uncharacterized protein n=1 Tax=Pristionchus pacificus TaxID=54126 RepID=A0A2A6B699_PRIPA